MLKKKEEQQRQAEIYRRLADAYGDEKLDSMLEQRERKESFQIDALRFLEDNDILHFENEAVVLDVEKLLSIQPSAIAYDKKGQRYLGNKYGYIVEAFKDIYKNYPEFYKKDGVRNLATFLMNTFDGVDVVDKNEWEAWEENGREGEAPEEKPVFYKPKSKDAAFDPEEIKESKFHIGLWNIKGEKPETYPIEGKEVSFVEASFAALVYHPEHGDGERDE
ncbi:MAG: hypothetical protein ABII02_02655 [Candidatus Magasanikbacteria bacterium]